MIQWFECSFQCGWRNPKQFLDLSKDKLLSICNNGLIHLLNDWIRKEKQSVTGQVNSEHSTWGVQSKKNASCCRKAAGCVQRDLFSILVENAICERWDISAIIELDWVPDGDKHHILFTCFLNGQLKPLRLKNENAVFPLLFLFSLCSALLSFIPPTTERSPSPLHIFVFLSVSLSFLIPPVPSVLSRCFGHYSW